MIDSSIPLSKKLGMFEEIKQNCIIRDSVIFVNNKIIFLNYLSQSLV